MKSLLKNICTGVVMVLLITTVNKSFAQNAEFTRVNNIFYYPDSSSVKDAYIYCEDKDYQSWLSSVPPLAAL
ncbi:MAG: hypothetical protein EOO88_45545 [Pedobacter sp.]|nr:MAG: hypothetical protein EOO88_45545 [Pedobacter sp.]